LGEPRKKLGGTQGPRKGQNTKGPPHLGKLPQIVPQLGPKNAWLKEKKDIKGIPKRSHSLGENFGMGGPQMKFGRIFVSSKLLLSLYF